METKKKTTVKKFVIFKRCGKASGIVRLPEKNAKVSITELKTTLDIKPGDVINTKKENQLFILLVSEVDVSYMFDLEKSSFEPNYILARVAMEDQVKVRLPLIKLNGNDAYIINRRVVSLKDIVDLSIALLGEESKACISKNKKGELFIPRSIHSLIGSVKESLFANVIE